LAKDLGVSKKEPQGRVPVPRPAKQQNNLSASLPWNGRWGFFYVKHFNKPNNNETRKV
jgi:hypothetical protein